MAKGFPTVTTKSEGYLRRVTTLGSSDLGGGFLGMLDIEGPELGWNLRCTGGSTPSGSTPPRDFAIRQE